MVKITREYAKALAVDLQLATLGSINYPGPSGISDNVPTARVNWDDVVELLKRAKEDMRNDYE